jgi:2-polyprenyl-3-methyl-5-hydroxy-6-metoxy-1,4-benzoquinol methylase
MPVDQDKLQAFLGRAVQDMGAAMSTALVVIGDKLGLYKALAESNPLTPAELAAKTGTHQRYVHEWLNNQAAGGYVNYDAQTQRYSMSPEQVTTLADESSPVFIPGAFELISAALKAEPRIAENFRSGAGLDWCEHDPGLFRGTERFFRPNYVGNLVSSWIPSFDGVEAKLQAGARVADVGCGHGASTILMGQAYPRSNFVGFDYHAASIEAARERAQKAGVADRVTFEVAQSTDFPGQDYDLVTHFDCLHDMGDPTAAARRVYDTLAEDSTWMIVEPFANNNVQDNLNPVGRVYYAASTLVCVPASLAHHGPALGAQAEPFTG